jgi:hypothetical protein
VLVLGGLGFGLGRVDGGLGFRVHLRGSLGAWAAEEGLVAKAELAAEAEARGVHDWKNALLEGALTRAAGL